MHKKEADVLEEFITLLGEKSGRLKKSIFKYPYRRLLRHRRTTLYRYYDYPFNNSIVVFEVYQGRVTSAKYLKRVNARYQKSNEIKLTAFRDFFIGHGFDLKEENEDGYTLEIANFLAEIGYRNFDGGEYLLIKVSFENLDLEKGFRKDSGYVSEHMDFI